MKSFVILWIKWYNLLNKKTYINFGYGEKFLPATLKKADYKKIDT